MRFVVVSAIALSLLVTACSGSPATAPTPSPEPTFDPSPPVPVSGVVVPEMAHYDRIIGDLMVKWGVPGGAVAVAKGGHLVFAHGYGEADVETGERAQPDSLFRIASLSKPITSAAVLKLAEEGRLELDGKVFDVLSAFRPESGFPDRRLEDVTIRDLLYHAGGWDRYFDPMFASRTIAAARGVSSPPGADEILRYMVTRTRPLDDDPGARYAYSNFGYSVLGRVIEAVTGQRYESFVRSELLAPLGITRMQIGGSLAEDRRDGEVRYYGQRDFPSVFDNGGEPVPVPYGGFYLEAMDAHGGWIASAVDLVRFVVALDGLGEPPLLQPESVETMVARPPGALWPENADSYYAMGWQVRPVADDANWWHTGSLPGTTTLLARTYNGFAWAALFNWGSVPAAAFTSEVDTALWQAFNEVREWPSGDLFDRYYDR